MFNCIFSPLNRDLLSGLLIAPVLFCIMNPMKKGEYEVREFPLSRLATFDAGTVSRKKHAVSGFLEIDITDARNSVRRRIKQGENISFLAWMVKTIGDPVDGAPAARFMTDLAKRLENPGFAPNDAMNKANTIDGIIRMFRKRTTDGCTASGSKGTRPND